MRSIEGAGDNNHDTHQVVGTRFCASRFERFGVYGIAVQAREGVSKLTIELGQSLVRLFCEGAKLYFRRVNAASGVDGRKIYLATLDDRRSPTTAVTNIQRVRWSMACSSCSSCLAFMAFMAFRKLRLPTRSSRAVSSCCTDLELAHGISDHRAYRVSYAQKMAFPSLTVPLALARLMRPHQWLKNVFVFAGLLFSQSWRDGPTLARVLLAFAAFCCASSMVYILNDWHDRASDGLHPTKRHRPLASGVVTAPLALALAFGLLTGAVLLASGNSVLLVLLGVYVTLNLAYSWRLKQVPVVDVSIIASGFMLRLLAGTVAVSIPPSRWLLLTGMFVALFLGFSKRKAESFHEASAQRAVLAHYPPALLDTFMAVTMTATLTTYSLFATSLEAQLQHGERLLYTVPVVIFGMLRYTYQVSRGHGEDVARDLLRDPWILGAGVCWLTIFSSRWL